MEQRKPEKTLGYIDDAITIVDENTSMRDGIHSVLEVCRRGYFCIPCLEEKWTSELETEPVLLELRRFMKVLFEFDEAIQEEKIKPERAVEELSDAYMYLYERIDNTTSASGISGQSAVLMGTEFLLAKTGGVPIMASLSPDLQVPTEEIIKLLQALIEELEEAANASRNREAQRLVRNLKKLIRILRAAGSRISLTRVLGMLRQILPRLLTILRSSLTAQRFHLVLRAILNFARGVAGLMPGGAAGGTGAAGGSAAGTALWYIFLILAAFGLGCLIGWLIGNIQIGDQTIHEWLGDCFYWLLFAPSKDCTEAYALFQEGWSRVRNARRDGNTDAEAAGLAIAILGLREYLEQECEEDVGVYERQLKRMEERLSELTGG